MPRSWRVDSVNKDTVTGIVGALVLVGAMTGVFVYERGQFHEYEVGWSLEAGPPDGTTGDLDHGQSDPNLRFEVNVTDGLVAGVELVLTWDATGDASDDEFRVTLTPPGGTAMSRARTGGSLTLSSFVQDAPQNLSVADRSPDGALEQAWAAVNETARAAGQGVWTVEVTLVSAMRPNDVAVLDDVPGSNDYTLDFLHTFWRPDVQRVE